MRTERPRSSAARRLTRRPWIDASRKSIARAGSCPVSERMRGRDEAVVLREAVDGAAPRHLHDAVGRRELGGRLARARGPASRGGPASTAASTAAPATTPTATSERTLAARTEPRRDEAEREREPAQRRHVTAASRGAVVSSAHTACAASTNARAAAEWCRSRWRTSASTRGGMPGRSRIDGQLVRRVDGERRQHRRADAGADERLDRRVDVGSERELGLDPARTQLRLDAREAAALGVPDQRRLREVGEATTSARRAGRRARTGRSSARTPRTARAAAAARRSSGRRRRARPRRRAGGRRPPRRDAA